MSLAGCVRVSSKSTRPFEGVVQAVDASEQKHLHTWAKKRAKPKMSLMDFSSHVLVVFAVWAEALSYWKITSDCSSLENNFSIAGSKPFCNIILHSKALIDFSQWRGSPVPAAKKAPLYLHSLFYFSPDLWTHLWSNNVQIQSWFITPYNSAEPLWIKLSIFWQKLNSVFDVFLRQQ